MVTDSSGTGRGSVDAFGAGQPVRVTAEADGAGDVDALARVNVAVQVARIEAIPVVAAAVGRTDLQVSGMFFDIRSARVEVLDSGQDRFVAPAAAFEQLAGSRSDAVPRV